MWKLMIGFVAFAALALWVLSQGGDVDMGGERHGAETAHAAAPVASGASR